MAALNDTELQDLIQTLINERILNIRTTTIGKISKINGNTINVLPVINASVDGRSVRLPEFINVPFKTIQGGTSYIIMPLTVGDYCLLHVCERDFDNWWLGENYKVPREYQIHDYSNTIAEVGLNNTKNPIQVPIDGRMLMNGDVNQLGDYFHTGDREQTGEFTLIGNLENTGNITTTGKLTSDTLNVNGQEGVSGSFTSGTLTITNGIITNIA